MSHDVFISYSRKDLAFVRSFAKRIEDEVHTVPWVDLKGIETGVQFEDVIVEAINNCELVLFLFSKNSLGSPWTKKEVMYAKNVGKKIYPIVIDGSQLSGWFLFEYGDVNYIDYSKDEQVDKLFGDMRDYLNRTTEYVCDDSSEGPRGSLDRSDQRISTADGKTDATEMFRMFAKAKREYEMIAKLSDDEKATFAEEVRALEVDFEAAKYAKTCSADGEASYLLKLALEEINALKARIAAERKKNPRPGDEMSIVLPGGVPMIFCWCPATTSAMWQKLSQGGDFFWMGSPESESERKSGEVRHRVRLTQGFWMGKYEVTQQQWGAVMETNPSDFKGSDRPVECVRWEECQEFIRKINAMGRVYVAMPTEAQWEYACRAGTSTPYNFGSSLNGDMANCDGRRPYGMSSGFYMGETSSVGKYPPNGWGLCDMHGNVWEWCQDWNGGYEGDATDPTGPSTGNVRVCRGGSWLKSARRCRSAYRGSHAPDDCYNSLGLRLVCSIVSHG